jgi:hypothetical protein
MRGQLMRQVLHSRDRTARDLTAGRHARLGWAVTLAAGLASAAGLAGAQQTAMSQTAFSPSAAPQTTAQTLAQTTVQASVPAAADVNAPAAQSTAQTSASQPGLPGPSHLDASLGVQAGTMGFGVQAGKLIFSHLGVRGAFNFFNYGVNNSVSNVSYSARLRFQNIPVMLDLFPWSRGAFHFTGGVVFDQNRITGTGQPDQSGDLSINHNEYSQSQVGTLSAAIRYHATAGYAGIGFGTPARNSLMEFTVDLGAMISTPHVELNATGAGSNPQLQSDVQAQQASTQTDVNKYAKIYPVISMGLAVRL